MNTKNIYLLGWEVHLNGDEQCLHFIATQATDKDSILQSDMNLELVFENDRLARVYEYKDGQATMRPLQPDEAGMPYPEGIETNQQYRLEPSIDGPHQMGGELPTDFQFPEHQCAVSFQYLGYISDKAAEFRWLPFTLHLACPIYLNFDYMFLDYTDALHPVLLNKEAVERVGTCFEADLHPHSEIVFEAMPFQFIPIHSEGGMGHAGIPNWMQFPKIPVCPKSGERMRFVCQLNHGVKTQRSNLTAVNTRMNEYYSALIFGGDGDLYVFFEPTSRVACYFIQST